MKCEIKEMEIYVANKTKYIKIVLCCIKHDIYFNSDLQKLNPGHCLIKKVAVPLLSAKQFTVGLSTAEGSHHLILDMQPHEVFPALLIPSTAKRNIAVISLFPPSLATSPTSWPSSSHTSYVNISSLVSYTVCDSNLQYYYYYMIFVLQMTHLLSSDPVTATSVNSSLFSSLPFSFKWNYPFWKQYKLRKLTNFPSEVICNYTGLVPIKYSLGSSYDAGLRSAGVTLKPQNT